RWLPGRTVRWRSTLARRTDRFTRMPILAVFSAAPDATDASGAAGSPIRYLARGEEVRQGDRVAEAGPARLPPHVRSSPAEPTGRGVRSGRIAAIRKLGIAWTLADAVSMRRRCVVSDNGREVGWSDRRL